MLTELLLQFCSINKKSLFIQDRDRIKMDFHPGYKLYRRKNALTQSAASRLPNHFIAGPSASSQLLDQPDGYLCDSIFLQTQKDICIFQGEDTLLRSYIWDNSWLHSHRNTKVFHITGYSLVQTLSLYISISNFRHFNEGFAPLATLNLTIRMFFPARWSCAQLILYTALNWWRLHDNIL